MKILVIKSNQLGDTIVDLPLVEAVIDRVGPGNVHVVTTPIAEGLYEHLVPEENRLVMPREEFNSAWKNPRAFAAILRWVRACKPSGVLLPNDQGNVARLVARLSGATRVVEMENPRVSFPKVGAISVQPDLLRPMHEKNWEVFRVFSRSAGWPVPPETPPRPSRAFPGMGWSGASNGPVLIHPGSSRPATRWGGERFAELARGLASRGLEVLWMKESDDPPPSAPGIRVLERRPLMEFARIAGGCRAFVGNNSGPMHLCDALGVPMVVLCGPVSPEWDPYWSARKALVRDPSLDCQPCERWGYRVKVCPRELEPFACMTRPSVAEVLERVLQVAGEKQSVSVS